MPTTTDDPHAITHTIRLIIMRPDIPPGRRAAMVAVVLEPDATAAELAESTGVCIRTIRRARSEIRTMTRPRRGGRGVGD